MGILPPHRMSCTTCCRTLDYALLVLTEAYALALSHASQALQPCTLHARREAELAAQEKEIQRRLAEAQALHR